MNPHASKLQHSDSDPSRCAPLDQRKSLRRFVGTKGKKGCSHISTSKHNGVRRGVRPQLPLRYTKETTRESSPPSQYDTLQHEAPRMSQKSSMDTVVVVVAEVGTPESHSEKLNATNALPLFNLSIIRQAKISDTIEHAQTTTRETPRHAGAQEETPLSSSTRSLTTVL